LTDDNKEVEKKDKPKFNENGIWIETEEEIKNWEDI